MKKNILFSFIGRSDPIAKDKDGPLIHILRHNKINKAYLYYSKEMIERKSYLVIEKAIKALNKNIEIINIFQEELVNPHKFGLLDKDLRSIFTNRIYKENKNAEFYANLSSGTPQMCSSLNLVCSQLSFPVKLIQVLDPSPKKPRQIIEDYTELSGVDILELSLDNNESQNRCEAISNDNIVKLIITENISSLLDSYNYYEADRLIKRYSSFYDEETKNIIKKAYLKYANLYEEARKIKTNYDIFPISNQKVSSLYGYILYLQTLQESGIITVFARSISPCLVSLLLMIIQENFKIDIKRLFK